MDDDRSYWQRLAEEAGVVMDTPRFRRPRGRKLYAHVTANDMQALESFAFVFYKRVNSKRERPHFDAPADIIPDLKRMGVKVVPSPEIVRRSRALAQSRRER
jgi:hypothetical protein